MNGPPVCSRGEIWMLDWNPRRDSEQAGYRPGIIVQSDLGNHAPGARTTIVVPLTTQERPYAFYIPLPKGRGTGLKSPSWANCTQILTIDTARLKERLGCVDEESLGKIGMALLDTLELGSTRPIPSPC